MEVRPLLAKAARVGHPAVYYGEAVFGAGAAKIAERELAVQFRA